MPYLSFVVLSFNNWEFTHRCLDTLAGSVAGSWAGAGVEIVLVDNGSDDTSRARLQSYCDAWSHPFIALRSVMLEQNLGYPSGINVGLAAANGGIVGVLNNDLVFPPDWFEALVDALETDKSLGVAAPYLSFAASVQNVNRQFSSYDDMVQFARTHGTDSAGTMEYVDKVIGACMLMRRDFLQCVGGNDFWYGVGNYDDDDWCLRARIAGYKLAVVGGSFVEHIGHATFRLDTETMGSSLQSNALKFELKWDLAERANANGAYARRGVLRHTRFDRARHFVPVAFEDFSSSGAPYYPKTSECHRVLFVADWNSPPSGWRSALTGLLRELTNAEVCLWLPQSHFERDKILGAVQQQILEMDADVQSSQIEFVVFSDEVPFVDTLRVIRSADAVLHVSNDFVNRFIVHMARLAEVEIMQLPQ